MDQCLKVSSNRHANKIKKFRYLKLVCSKALIKIAKSLNKIGQRLK